MDDCGTDDDDPMVLKISKINVNVSHETRHTLIKQLLDIMEMSGRSVADSYKLYILCPSCLLQHVL